MKRLSKDQLAELEKHRAALDSAKDEYEVAYNKLREVAEDAAEFLRPIAEAARSYFDERSEKWQEGDAGQAYESWVSDLEDLQDELSDPDVLDFDDILSRFAEMPTEPEA